MSRSLASDMAYRKARDLVGRAWSIPEDIVVVGCRLSIEGRPQLLDDFGRWHEVQSVLDGTERDR